MFGVLLPSSLVTHIFDSADDCRDNIDYRGENAIESIANVRNNRVLWIEFTTPLQTQFICMHIPSFRL